MNDSKENTWIEQYFDLIKKIFDSKKYDEYVDGVLDTYRLNKHPPFIFCFSEKKDCLSQWRAYSTDGQGVCIGFNITEFGLDKEIPFPSSVAEKTLGILNVNYSQKNHERIISRLSEYYKNFFDDNGGASIFNFSMSLIELSLMFKNNRFSEEKEWRIIHTPTQQGEYELPFHRLSDLNFRVDKLKILTYYKYCLDDIFSSKLIPEIILGSKSKMDISVLKHFLDRNNLNKTKILQSNTFYV